MNSFTGILDTISSTMRGSTRTGLDVLKSTPMEATVTMNLYKTDRVPAKPSDIVDAYLEVFGTAPDMEQIIDIEEFLLDFEWLDLS